MAFKAVTNGSLRASSIFLLTRLREYIGVSTLVGVVLMVLFVPLQSE